MKLVDSHCHLDYNNLSDDLQMTIRNAEEAGVGAILTIGTTIENSRRLPQWIEHYQNIWCSAGIHPHEAAKDAEDISALVLLAAHPKVVALGETGLDYHYDNSPREAQRRVFREHIGMAVETGLPLVIHTREAEADTARLLADAARDGVGGVLHCFSSSRQLAELALEAGFYISISGIVTFKNAEGLRQIVHDLPLDRLMIETDAPYLAPVPYRGRPNEPALLIHTARKVAELKGLEVEALARATADNFFRLFAKAARPPGFL
ncbi:MAG TPA: TatD family hydrolase [Alphaproteobacteria bacterium]|nr:TatD family hydrolase [Alphaproteobacteria bacterium]